MSGHFRLNSNGKLGPGLVLFLAARIVPENPDDVEFPEKSVLEKP